MSDVTIRVPRDIVQALRLPPDAVAVELQREPALHQRNILPREDGAYRDEPGEYTGAFPALRLSMR